VDKRVFGDLIFTEFNKRGSNTLMKYRIGEFSKITSMTIKSLRFYHEKGVLEPSVVDSQSGYRYYRENDISIAHSIRALRALEFSITEIKAIVDSCEDDCQIRDALRSKAKEIATKIKKYQAMQEGIQEILALNEGNNMNIETNQVLEKQLGDLLVASIRVKARYEETGKFIGQLYKTAGRHAEGKPINLYWDNSYVENDADIEVCLPVKKAIKAAAPVSTRTLIGGRAVSIVHKGPYGTQGSSYKAGIDYMTENNLTPTQVPREVFLKGPGMIFKGNPENYLTEIIWIVEERS